jgi:hypothetical protein
MTLANSSFMLESGIFKGGREVSRSLYHFCHFGNKLTCFKLKAPGTKAKYLKILRATSNYVKVSFTFQAVDVLA